MIKGEPATDLGTRRKDGPMRCLRSGAAGAVLLLGALGGCASPHYPIDAGQTPGPAPLTQARPQYPIDQAADAPAAQSAAAPAAAETAASPADPPPASAPVAPVDAQPLPPPSAASTPSGGTLQPAALATPGDAAAPVASPSPAAVDTETPAPSEPALTPQAVSHDQPPGGAPAPLIRQASATPSPSYTPPAGYNVGGQVVDASGAIFEAYQVQPGDHIDALARAFNTTRDILLNANAIRAPYVIRPGQIIRVPVAKAYVTEGGDTLAGVARRFSVGVGELAQINGLSEHAELRPGMQIGLPSSMRDRGPLPGSQYAYPETHGYQPPEPQGYGHYTPSAPQQPHLTQVSPAEPPLAQDQGTHYATPQPPSATAQASFGMTDAQIAQAAHGRFVWPVQGDILEHFGPQGIGRRNDGLDIRAAQGTPVRAAAPGEVVYAGDQVPGFGNLVLIKHADGWVTAYAHLDQVAVQMKQEVTQGETVGSVGATGGAAQPELHFEVRYAPSPADKAKPVDPVLVLPTG
jgi:murein DD-endopeptidase MepM/ murein hydrolase activator NlpD